MSGAFKKDDAIAFADSHSLHDSVVAILSARIHPELRTRSWRVKKGLFVELFEREGLVDDFVAQYWQARHTAEGQEALNRYLSDKALNEELVARDPSEASITEIQIEKLEVASEVTFGLERDLQNALRANIEQLEPGLQINDDGKERQCEAGRIDITAKDLAGKTVIIELKAGIARPEALTQLLAYMGTIGNDQQDSVRGFLIAEDFHSKVIFGARAVPAIELWTYRFKFTFERKA
jgi:Endonuclease NucS